jgi:hypothetical protein
MNRTGEPSLFDQRLSNETVHECMEQSLERREVEQEVARKEPCLPVRADLPCPLLLVLPLMLQLVG